MSINELSPDVRTIVEATQWLTTSADTHGGYQSGDCHVVEELATTDDGSTYAPKGVYFAHKETYRRDGSLVSSDSIKLVSHADPESHQDYVPVTYSGPGEPALWQDSHEKVDTRALVQFPEAQLARMANNARAVLGHYGIEVGA